MKTAAVRLSRPSCPESPQCLRETCSAAPLHGRAASPCRPAQPSPAQPSRCPSARTSRFRAIASANELFLPAPGSHELRRASSRACALPHMLCPCCAHALPHAVPMLCPCPPTCCALPHMLCPPSHAVPTLCPCCAQALPHAVPSLACCALPHMSAAGRLELRWWRSTWRVINAATSALLPTAVSTSPRAGCRATAARQAACSAEALACR